MDSTKVNKRMIPRRKIRRPLDKNSPGLQIQDHGSQKKEAVAKRTNILNILTDPELPPLQQVWLDDSETTAIPFATEMEEVDVHFSKHPPIRGFIQCNGDDCCLCRIGNKREKRFLLPVYLPASGSIGVLAVSPSQRTHALWPQLANVLRSGKPVVMFITREDYDFSVRTAALPDDVDAGEVVIEKFKEDYEAGRICLTSTIPRMDNEQLADIPQIARVLAFKRR